MLLAKGYGVQQKSTHTVYTVLTQSVQTSHLMNKHIDVCLSAVPVLVALGNQCAAANRFLISSVIIISLNTAYLEQQHKPARDSQNFLRQCHLDLYHFNRLGIILISTICSHEKYGCSSPI